MFDVGFAEVVNGVLDIRACCRGDLDGRYNR